MLKLRGRRAPADERFRAWAAGHADERTAELLSAFAGVYTFHHDPGELSAAFVWERTSRLATPAALRALRDRRLERARRTRSSTARASSA